ncbi:hypothetical protein ACPPVU_02020 [Mucilaginibacter sp. McL0603]|uniref:hypothetical protein n=1 Tax=Mucilaginibacter sp. McL0603 TaxID=3415670 RepID=UPI003CF22415
MKSIIFLSILLLFIGCNKPVHRNNKITKIEFARSGAWADFGASISIDSGLNYKYWGDYKSAKQKYFVGKISKGFWDTLNIKLEGIKFKTVTLGTDRGCMDCEYYELIVHWENRTKRILRNDSQPEDSVMSVFKWLDRSHNILKLREVKDSIKFEDRTHFVLKQSIKSIKFPPPQNSNN